MIDQFTLEDFEKFLDNPAFKPCEALGLQDGEYCYRLTLDGQSAIMLRSSIGANGVAAKSGKDSIRLWLVGNDEKPLGSKIDSWTTRVSGWQDRLFNKIHELVKRRTAAGDCKDCGKPFGIYKRRSDKALFVKCFPCSKKLNKNINGSLLGEGWFSPTSQMNVTGLIEPKVSPELKKELALDEFLADPFVDFEEDEPEQASFKPSAYQQAIYDFVKNGSGHGVVSGVAGCGKTTTNVEALKLVPRTAKIKYAAFNKHIERDISAKAPKHVNVSTFHSWGLGNIKKAYPKININQWKVHNLIDDQSPYADREFKNEIVKTIGLLKGNLLEPTQANIMKMAMGFGLDIEEKDCGLIKEVFLASIENFNEIDFEDMVYYPASGIVSCEKFDYIFVDEAQDMNMAQYQLSKKSLAANGRMLLIGDPYQSIYGFRGAYIGIMDFMAQEMNATELPLTISYRAPLAVVEHVNTHYSHIKFEASETAKNGKIEQISLDQFYGLVSKNDSVLCRTNAPLVEPCFSLIRRGIKATILGRDIGTGLIKLIEKRQKMKRVRSLDDLLEQVDVYCSNEARKALKQKKEARAALLMDQAETIYALSAECKTIRDLKSKCKMVFSDKKEGVVFGTVHKAKGLEWNRVFVIGPKGNHPMGDEAQETNIRYVRDTRTLNELYFVEE
jgi:DNA helicase-2/ATP-dependent DNA helicase PcrA